MQKTGSRLTAWPHQRLPASDLERWVKSSGVRQSYVCQASVAPVHWGEDKSPHGSSILYHCRHADRPTDQRDYRADRSSHP